MPAVLWTTDQNLRITSHWGAGFGPSKAEGRNLGRTLYDYLKCQDPHAAPMAQHAEALRGISSYLEHQRGNRHFSVHAGPLREASGEIAGCIAAGIDITERIAKIKTVTRRPTMRWRGWPITANSSIRWNAKRAGPSAATIRSEHSSNISRKR
jgi:hypothetical protein